MEKTEADRLREVREAFNRGRIKLASLAALAVVSLWLVAVVAHGDTTTLGFAFGLAAIASSSLYFGRAPGRAVLPAFILGLIPFCSLLFVRAATGYACHLGGCNAICLPTCIASGLVAGGLLAFFALRTRSTLGFVSTAAGITWLVGAMGCPCAGFASIAGLAGGILAPLIITAPKIVRSGAP